MSMAGLYLYAIADAPLTSSVHGMFGRRLRSINVGPLHAIVEAVDRPPRPTLARLRAQNRVLHALAHANATLLPARFGAFSRTRRELERALTARRVHLARTLRHVRGCVQVTVRLVPALPPPRPARVPGGAAYLRQLADQSRARSTHPDVRRISRAAGRYTRAERVEWHDGPALAASIYHLVPRARLQGYLAAVSRLADAGGLKLTVAGPWLPFAFVEDVT
jgi:hypothetical protein